MFDKQILNDVLVNYKKDFIPSEWEKEEYKWIAVKCFQSANKKSSLFLRII